MSARSFFDTNVLASSDDKAVPAKRRRALELIADQPPGGHRRSGAAGVTGVFRHLTRKLHVDAGTARWKVELLAEFDVVAPEVADILAAIDLHRLHGFSFWDALVLQSVKQAGCSVLFAEDLQDARELDGLLVVNRFPLEGAGRLRTGFAAYLERASFPRVAEDILPSALGLSGTKCIPSRVHDEVALAFR